MYALVIDGTVQGVFGRLPQAARNLTTGEWVCPEGGDWSVAEAEACGYFEVVETVRPPDTQATTFTGVVQMVSGTPTLVWTEVPKTQEQITAETEQTNLSTIDSNLLGDLDQLAIRITEMSTLIGVTNSTINGSPASYIKNVAQAVRDCMQAERRLIRKVRGVLDGTT